MYNFQERRALMEARRQSRGIASEKTTEPVTSVKLTLTVEINGKISTVMVEDATTRGGMSKLLQQVQRIENADKIAEIQKSNAEKRAAMEARKAAQKEEVKVET